MRFEDQSPGGEPVPPPPPPPPPEQGPRARRRSPRSWSSPPVPPPPRSERPASPADWSFQSRRARPDGGSTADPAPEPARVSAVGAPPPGALPVDLRPLEGLLHDLRADLERLRAEVASSPAERGSTLVTGAELAASIEALGTTLGTGMATLLTEHRNLLARDVDAAADRILEELAQRLRSHGAQTVDAVEERLRQVLAKSVTDLTEQLDVRLDQLQTDLAGLRAVILEVPDQTAVIERLDQIVEGMGSARSLATEVAALRRRISLRNEPGSGAAELSDGQLDDLADRLADRLRSSTVPSVSISAEPVDPADADDEGPEAPASARPAPRAGARRTTRRR